MRRVAPTLLVIAAVAAAASSVGAADRAKSHVVRFAVPSAGNFTVAVLEVRVPRGSKAKPHPVVMKTGVPQDVDVITGVRRDPKRARSYVEAIVILRHATAKRVVSSVSGAAGGNIVVDPFGTASQRGLVTLNWYQGCSQVANALTSPGPQFSHCGPSRNTFVINVCATNLLFPFVNNISGFDTGLSSGNTAVAGFDVACHGKRSIRYSNMLKVLGLSEPPPPPPVGLCTTSLVDQGTLNEVISNTLCPSGVEFNALLLMPLNGNSITDFFPENGQATCSENASGALFCLFGSTVGASGPIDVQFLNLPSTSPNLQIQRSTDGGNTWQPDTWNSTGS